MTSTTDLEKIVYPESDGKPLSDNTKQFELITVIHGNMAISIPWFLILSPEISVGFPFGGSLKSTKLPM